MREVNYKDTNRAYAFEMWANAPMPMVTLFKTLDVTPVLRFGRRHDLKFNMLMCWCIGRAASQVGEFYMLPVAGRLIEYDSLAVNTIVADSRGGISSCDVPYCDNLPEFNARYLRLTRHAIESCENHDIADSMVIGTSALVGSEIDGAVGMYSGIFNNPFMIWGRYKKGLFKTTLKVSFQFHHTQMDGVHAARFLDLLQKQITALKQYRTK